MDVLESVYKMYSKLIVKNRGGKMDITSLINSTKQHFKIWFSERDNVSFLDLQEYISTSIYETIWNKGITNLNNEEIAQITRAFFRLQDELEKEFKFN